MGKIKVIDNVFIYNDMPRGWVYGKDQPLWHKKVYDMWWGMWRRVYGNEYYFGSLIYPEFRYLSKYVHFIVNEHRFKDFCNTCNKAIWTIDKDIKDSYNRNYYPEFMTLTTQIENTKERNDRRGNPNTKVPVIAMGKNNKILLFKSLSDAKNKKFDPSAIGRCVNKKWKSYKGYKWYKANYKHNKILRLVHKI